LDGNASHNRFRTDPHITVASGRACTDSTRCQRFVYADGPTANLMVYGGIVRLGRSFFADVSICTGPRS
jgi:hypothetical protein